MFYSSLTCDTLCFHYRKEKTWTDYVDDYMEAIYVHIALGMALNGARIGLINLMKCVLFDGL